MGFEQWKKENSGFDAWQKGNVAVAEPPVQRVTAETQLPGPQFPGDTPRDIRVSRGSGAARTDPSLAGRAAKQYVNKAILDLVEQSRPSSNVVESVTLMTQVAKDLESLPEDPTFWQGVKSIPKIWWSLVRNYYAPQSKGERAYAAEELKKLRPAAKFDVPPAETVGEKAVDIGAGIGAFVTQLLVARKLIPAGTVLPDAVAWEILNQAEGGIPGKGAAIRGSLGAISKIPTVSAGGKAAKIVAGGGLFGGITAAEGGSFEDIAVSAAIGAGFQAWGILDQTQWLKGFKQELLKAEKGRVQQSLVDQKARIKAQHKRDLVDKPEKAADWFRRRNLALTRNANAEMQRMGKAVDQAMDVVARKLHHGKLKGKEAELAKEIVEKGLTRQAVAEVGKVKLPATKGEKAFAKAEAKAHKDIASGDPKRVAAGNRVLDFLRKVEKGKGKPAIEGIREPTVAQKVGEVAKRPVKAVERAAKQAEVEIARKAQLKPPQPPTVPPGKPPVAEPPAKVEPEGVKPTKAQQAGKEAETIDRVATRIKSTGEVVVIEKDSLHGDTDIKAISIVNNESVQDASDRIDREGVVTTLENAGVEQGFITSKGRFVGRNEAAKIAGVKGRGTPGLDSLDVPAPTEAAAFPKYDQNIQAMEKRAHLEEVLTSENEKLYRQLAIAIAKIEESDTVKLEHAAEAIQLVQGDAWILPRTDKKRKTSGKGSPIYERNALIYKAAGIDLPAPTEAAKEIEHEQEAVTEPAPSPEVGQRETGKPVPKVATTGKLDPADPKDALEITNLHANWVAGGTKWRPRNIWEGIHSRNWNTIEQKYDPGDVEYTPEQVDAAYRLVQKAIPSPMPDVNLFAMPGKESQLQAIAEKMRRMKPPKKGKKKPKLPRPTALPKAKAKTKKEDHIKAVYIASGPEAKTRYALAGVFVEGDNLVATDGRRMFMAKGTWGKDGLYLDAASLKGGVLGKADKTGLKFPKWQDIVPLVHKSDAIIVEDLNKMWRHVIQASLLADEVSGGLVILANKDGSLGFATANPEVGHSEINVWPGAKILGAVNPRFLMDSIAFHAKRGDTSFEFYFQHWERPILTRSLDGKTSTIIMPCGMGEVSKELKEAISEKPAAKKGKGTGAIGTISRGRIQVSMEPAGKVQTAAQIVHYVERAFNIPMRGKATHTRKKALGWFDAKAVGIRLKNVREITTAVHEIGHHIDWTLNKRMSLKPPKGTKDELMAMGRALYGSRKPPGGYKSEGWAEFIRMDLTGEDTKAAAPNLHEWFHKTYLPKHQDIRKKLDKTREMITQWRMQGAEARIESQVNRRTIKGSIAERLQRGILWFETKWIDKFAPIRKAVQATGEKLRWDLDPFQIATARASKAGAIARQMVLEYTTDTAGNYTGPGLREVIKPVRKDIRAFTRYMMAARGRNLWKRGINPGFSLADANFVFEKHDSPEWQEAAQAVTDWNHRILDYLVEAGGLEAAVAKHMKELNPVYIPFLRAFKVGEINKPSGVGKGFATTGKSVKGIKGSGRQTIEMLEAMIQQTAKLIGVAHKTEVAKALAGLAKKPGMAAWIWKVPAPKQATQFEAEQLKKEITQIAVQRLGLDPAEIPFETETWDDVLTVFTNAGQFFGKENIVAIVIDGKKQFYEVHPQLYRAIAGLDKYNLPLILDILFGKATRMLRLGATGLNAAFGLIRNPLRDALTFTVLSKHAKLGPVSAAAGIVGDVINTKTARRFKALGGKMSGQILFDRRATQHLRGELLATSIAGRTVYHATHPINALRELFGVTEAGTRIGEFGPALKAAEKKYGRGSKAAAIAALNAAQDVTTNFTRNGEYARVLNQMIAFFNAGIQGPSKILRTFRHRPIETMIKALVALTLPALWLWWRNRDKEWYKNLPLYEKTSYLHVEVPGEDKIIRLPVPFELGHLFQSIPVAVLDAQYQDDPDSMKGTMVEVMEQANPWDWPAVIGPIVDVIWNRNFAGVPIVSRSMEGKLPEDRVKTHTTALMRELGKLLKVSPAQLEHMVNAYSGGIYKRTARAFEKRGDSPSDIPVVGTLFLRDPFAPKAQVERFYERSDLLDQKNQSDQITPAENRERVLLGRIRRRLSPLWKNLRTAKTLKQRKQIWAKIEILLKLPKKQQQKPPTTKPRTISLSELKKRK